jgi:hypothetical protein
MKKVIGVTFAAIAVIALALATIPATRDELHWRWASHQDGATSYESYLKDWPDGRHATEAQRRNDELAWAAARAANTISSYRNYSSAHPRGQHAQEADATAAALRTDNAPFDAALQTGTEASLRAFLAAYPGHAREASAQQTLTDITEGRDIVDLLGEKKIEVEAHGSGIERVSVRIRRLVPFPFTVRIPVGTFFVSANPSAQNMVTTAVSTIQLTTGEWMSVSPAAACANRPRDIPDNSDRFTVQRSPKQAELAKLMPVLDKASVDSETRQAAVWIVTDDADYWDLGILVASQFGVGGSRVIREQETARAMRICDEAGIDITRKAIWRNRDTILSGLKDSELKTWLEQKK